MFKYFYFFIFAAFSPLLADSQSAAQPKAQDCPISIKDMSNDQKLVTGINKLTDDEKEAFDAWLCEQWNANQKMMQQEVSTTEQSEAPTDQTPSVVLTSLQEEGRRLVLSDGTMYTIIGPGIKKTSKWVEEDSIKVLTTKKTGVFKIKNITQDQTVRARLYKEQ